ncbi:MAG: hypothetical protein H7096_08055 [Flavobacterium sp.]|nr:hypothetical protein [Pedobacter sp.]
MELFIRDVSDTTEYNPGAVAILENQIIQLENIANNNQNSLATVNQVPLKYLRYSFQSLGYEGLLDNLNLIVTYTNTAYQPVVQVFKIEEKKVFVSLDLTQILPNSSITLNVRNREEKNIEISMNQSSGVPTELLELSVNELTNLRIYVTGNDLNAKSLDLSIGWMSFNTQNILY